MKATTTTRLLLLLASSLLCPTAAFLHPPALRSPITTTTTAHSLQPKLTNKPLHHLSHISPVTTLHASPLDDPSSPPDKIRSPVSILAGLAWLSFVTYAFLFSPGRDAAADALDADLLKAIIANPFDPAINPVFVAIFNMLGIVPFVYASLLLPGSRDQKPPAWPFIGASFFLGFFAVGPYLGLREYQPAPDAFPRKKWLAKAVENKIPAALSLASAVFLVYYALFGGGAAGGDISSRLAGYTALFSSQTFPHVSSLDLLVLSLFVADPMREDMLRRDWFSNGKLLAFAGVPVVGPCLYLLLRPSLLIEEEETEEE